MIDPRFPVQPSDIRIPLYPLKEERLIWNWAAAFLREPPGIELVSRVKSCFAEGDGHLLLSDSGTSSLLTYLHARQVDRSSPLRIALPAYCCPHLCRSLVQSGFHPIFLDLTKRYQLSVDSIDFAIKHRSDVLLWPNFFGFRNRDTNVIEYAAELGIDIIFDEAQAFPHDALSGQYPSLISFGPSKKAQGIAGGGLYVPKQRMPPATPIRAQVKRRVWTDLLEHAGDFARHLIMPARLYRPRNAPLERELPVLLNKANKKLHVSPSRDLTRFEQFVLLRRLRLLDSAAPVLIRLRDAMRDFVVRAFGRAALHPLEEVVGLPSIFAIRVDGSRRFEVAGTLAEKGIQTTWYYYPLNLLEAFSHFPAETMTHTEKLASEVLILPFGIGPATTCLDRYLNILKAGNDHKKP